MKKRHLFISLLMLLLSLTIQAQELTIKSMQASNDLSARQHQRLDLNGTPCALLKVHFNKEGAIFQGNVIQPVEYKNGEYWVYLTEGSREVRIIHPQFVALQVTFANFLPLRGLKSLTTYNLSLTYQLGKGNIKVDYMPDHVKVFLCDTLLGVSPNVFRDLPAGEYEVSLRKDGYTYQNRKITINGGQTTVLDGTLAPISDEVCKMREEADDYCYGRKGKKRDYAKALDLYQRAAALGDADSQTEIGLIYRWGKGVKQNYATAMKWYHLAAAQGWANAQNLIGDMYLNGLGVPQNDTEATKWYYKAACQDHVSGQCNYAYMYMNGRGVVKNEAEGAKWYGKAAELGYDWAQYMYGVLFYYGTGVTQDYGQAVRWLTKAANRNQPMAQVLLGDMYYNATGVGKSDKYAFDLYKQAAENDEPWGMVKVGFMYYKGFGTEKDYQKAADWWQKAADKGNSLGFNNLGCLYHDGLGVTRDYTKAVSYYRQAIEKDSLSVDALLNLGFCYEEGTGVAQNMSLAASYYERAAAGGSVVSQAWCNYYGKGASQDYGKAYDGFMKAVTEFDSDIGKYYLGECYAHGHGVRQNWSKALEWYQKAAEKRVLSAVLRLARCYAHGEGIEQSKENAMFWYQKAVEMGSKKAESELKSINK